MTFPTLFADVQLGDTVRVRNTVFPARRERTFEVTVRMPFTVDGSILGDSDQLVNNQQGWVVDEIVTYAGGIPNADFVVWYDWDHNPQMAARTGHPHNRVWSHNGAQMSVEDLVRLTDGHTVSPLIFGP